MIRRRARSCGSAKSFAGRGEPTVAPGKGLVFVINGLAGDIYAVKPGGKGDVRSRTWPGTRRARRTRSTLADRRRQLSHRRRHERHHHLLRARNGKQLWKERIRGKAFTASPIAAGGLVYFQNEAGETIVIEPGRRSRWSPRIRSVRPTEDLPRFADAVRRANVFTVADVPVLHRQGEIARFAACRGRIVGKISGFNSIRKIQLIVKRETADLP